MTEAVLDDDMLRGRIATRLADGLKTEVEPRCDTQEEVQAVAQRLKALALGDVDGRLFIAGFTDHPIMHEDIEEACETCMYYLVHRRFCELPELGLPVEPAWSCRLWRI
jgi:hypothetical protein